MNIEAGILKAPKARLLLDEEVRTSQKEIFKVSNYVREREYLH